MNIKIRIGDEYVTIISESGFQLESTLINKITPVLDSEKDYVDGFINYKGRIIDVLDISSLFNQPKLKKFDGLIFVFSNGNSIAIKYEGFHEVVEELNGHIFNVDNLF